MARVLGTIGLMFDIVGAFLVAIEVVRVYRGSITGGIKVPWKDMGKPF